MKKLLATTLATIATATIMNSALAMAPSLPEKDKNVDETIAAPRCEIIIRCETRQLAGGWRGFQGRIKGR